ncbi:MAG TPA: hypothetical protein VJJ82_01985 [Candidatus Nanoarchaeia archaeon]|nr:hypothetical protein [Candidatus Nanoarchaeia archaeon]
MRKNNLGDKAHILTTEDRVKGGKSKSPQKQMASRINGLLNREGLTPEIAFMLVSLREGRYEDLLKELLSIDLGRINQDNVMERVQKVLVKMLPSRNLNLNVDVNGSSVSVKQYEQFRDTVFRVVSSEQRQKILHGSSTENKSGGVE